MAVLVLPILGVTVQGSGVAVAMPAAAAGVSSVQNRASWLCLDSPSANDGQIVEQWTCNQGANQDWNASIDNPDGSKTFYNASFDKCLMADWSGRIEVYTCTAGTLQKWYPTFIGGQWNYWQNESLGTYIDVSGSSNGSPIVLNSYTGSDGQKWWNQWCNC